MTRMLTPWFARAARLPDFEMDFPKWMTEVLGPEAGIFGRDGKFLPEANMVETDKAIEVTVELPGMKPEEVKVEIKENALWVTGEKKEEKVDARFADGVLKIALPKAERVAPKQIEVKG